MDGLDGTWDVRRVSGALPPLVAMRKRISGAEGETVLGPVRAGFDVVGGELRYRSPFAGFVDVLEREDDGFAGRALLRGIEYGRFRLERVEAAEPPGDVALLTLLEETLALEEGVLRMLDGLVGSTDDPALVDLAARHRAQTEEHARRLRDRLAAHGRTAAGWREAVTVLGALAKTPLDVFRPPSLASRVRDAYAAEHLEIASYRLLEELAERMGDAETAEAARTNRADEEAMARALDERWAQVAELTLRP